MENSILDFISQPWHWSISGFMIAVVMFLLIKSGQKFGVSSSFQAMCSVSGAGKWFEYFDYDWRKHDWLLTFVAGAIIGGFIGSTLLASPDPVQVAASTTSDLAALGLSVPQTYAEGSGFLPIDIFNFDNLFSVQGLIVMVLGGMMIGFGTRYAGGCTSGHAITGLSNLQLPSLVAVIGFFIGGLVMTHLLLPYVLAL